MRYALRFLAIFALALLVAQPATPQEFRAVDDDGWCDDSWGGDDEHHCMVLETAMSAGGVRIDDLTNGGVSVMAWDGDGIRVRARVTGRARNLDRARELAESVRIRISGEDIDTEGERTSRNESWSVSYRIDVPGETNLDLETTNGGIRIEGVHGTLKVVTSNGGLTMVGVGGDVEGRTSNGGVRLELVGNTWKGSRLDLRTSNGGVRISVPEDYDAILRTSTTNGSINVDVPAVISGESRRRRTIELGNGGPELSVSTTNGSVRIERS